MSVPVVIFAYNRPDHLRRTLEALKKNRHFEEIELFFFADGCKSTADGEKVAKTRQVIKDFCSDKICRDTYVFEYDKNRGLANSVISGVTEVFKTHDRIIVLEDDILTTEDFLDYMNECLEFYKNDPRVGAISGYVPDFKIPLSYNDDVFLSLRGNSWGWATWKNIWDNVDWDVNTYETFVSNRKMQYRFDKTQLGASQMLIDQMNGKHDSWAIRWDYSFFERNLYTVYPVKTKVYNIGCDGSGTHCGPADSTVETQYDLLPSEYKLNRLSVNRTILARSSGNSFKENVRLFIRSL